MEGVAAAPTGSADAESVLSLTRRLFGGQPERRVAAWGDSSIPPPGSAGSMGGDSSAMQIISVYACVSLIADAVSTLPLYAYQRVGGNRRPVDPAPALIAQPFAEITRQDWLTQVMTSLLLRGNSYSQVAERDRLGYPTQLVPLHPDQVSVRRSPAGQREYRVNGTPTPSGEIVHIPGIMLPGALVGVNPIEMARTSLSLAKQAEAYGEAFFRNSAQASVVIEVPGSLDEDETLEMARAWSAAHQGVGLSHLPAVVTGGAKVTQISINPDDAQFLETRNLSRLEIAMLFRVPPHKLGDTDRTTSWGTGIEQQEIAWVTDTLRSWLSRIEGAITPLLPEDIFARFNLAGRLRGDTLQRFQAYTMARMGGWSNIDEIREKEDEPPLPDGMGQDYLQPLNYAPIGQAPADTGNTGEPPAGQRADTGMFEALLEFLSRHPEPATQIHNHVAPAGVTVTPPQVVVNNSPPAVTVEAAQVHLTPPPVTVAAPQVNVEVKTGARARRIERDAAGELLRIVEED